MSALGAGSNIPKSAYSTQGFEVRWMTQRATCGRPSTAAFSSVSVVCSSLSLRHYKRPTPVLREIRSVVGGKEQELAQLRW